MLNEIMIVLTNATDGRDEEFNEWYDGQHLTDVLEHGPFSAAQRFRIADLESGAGAPFRYLAIYEVEAGRSEEAREWILFSRREREEALDAGREPLVALSPALDEERTSWFFTSIGERREGPSTLDDADLIARESPPTRADVA